MCEVEKIWIINDVDNNGELDFAEIKDYLQQMVSGIEYSADLLEDIFIDIDKDGSGTIDKKEMFNFLKILMSMQNSLVFK